MNLSCLFYKKSRDANSKASFFVVGENPLEEPEKKKSLFFLSGFMNRSFGCGGGHFGCEALWRRMRRKNCVVPLSYVSGLSGLWRRIRAGSCSALSTSNMEASPVSSPAVTLVTQSFTVLCFALPSPLTAHSLPSKGPGSEELSGCKAQHGEDQWLWNVPRTRWWDLLCRGRTQADPCQMDRSRSPELW